MNDKTSFKYFLMETVITIIATLIIFPLFDFCIDNFITHSVFSYSVGKHIISPIVISITVCFIFWMYEKKKLQK